MLINGIEFKVIQNIKKIKKIYVKFKIINNEKYIILNTYRKLSENKINELINKNKKTIDKLISNINNNPLKENEIIILGKIFLKDQLKDKTAEAIQIITDLFNYYQNVFDKNTTELKFRKMKTRWGVCHITKNYICLSSYLIHLPIDLIEYVIIHEFCHFEFPNHSKSFYTEVIKYCPDYKFKVKQLKKFSYVLN